MRPSPLALSRSTGRGGQDWSEYVGIEALVGVCGGGVVRDGRGCERGGLGGVEGAKARWEIDGDGAVEGMAGGWAETSVDGEGDWRRVFDGVGGGGEDL